MKRHLYLLLAAGWITLAGCSSTPTKVDSGAIKARTFSFINTGSKPMPDFADKRQEIHKLIHNAITRNLAGKGVTQSDSGGDLTVAYLLIVGNNGAITSLNDYFGYRDDTAELLNKAQKAYTENNNPNYFEAGTLVIDILDGKSFKLLKRGYASRPLLKDLPEEARAARIQEVVDEILANLRITP